MATNVHSGHPLIKPVLEFVNSNPKGVGIPAVSHATGSHDKSSGDVLRWLANKRKIACLRPNGQRSYIFLPMASVGADYTPALRRKRVESGSRARNPNPGKVEGAFALLQIAGKMIEFESMSDLRRFIEAWGSEA
jgi:hypothetical protein